jgi:transaldolase
MNYLEWLNHETPTRWWHDSAIPSEIDAAIENGALGVTTNPVLAFKALQADPAFWAEDVAKIPPDVSGAPRVEALLKIVTTYAAGRFRDIYANTEGRHGYALAQVNPSDADSSDNMLVQGLAYASWAENIAVKLPTTGAALPVVEELAARGIAVCTTLNFSVSQALAADEAYARGVKRAKANGVSVRPCFIVQQGGRFDEYVSDVARDNRLPVRDESLMWAGNAICKRSYRLLQKRGSASLIMPAGLRGAHHLSEIAGAKMVLSLQTRVQRMILDANLPKETHIDDLVDESILSDLMQVDEFVRAYAPDGLKKEDFIKFGITQRTLSQFLWTGWIPLETYGAKIASSRWF